MYLSYIGLFEEDKTFQRKIRLEEIHQLFNQSRLNKKCVSFTPHLLSLILTLPTNCSHHAFKIYRVLYFSRKSAKIHRNRNYTKKGCGRKHKNLDILCVRKNHTFCRNFFLYQRLYILKCKKKPLKTGVVFIVQGQFYLILKFG